jgi:hypothetical protein
MGGWLLGSRAWDPERRAIGLVSVCALLALAAIFVIALLAGWPRLLSAGSLVGICFAAAGNSYACRQGALAALWLAIGVVALFGLIFVLLH